MSKLEKEIRSKIPYFNSVNIGDRFISDETHNVWEVDEIKDGKVFSGRSFAQLDSFLKKFNRINNSIHLYHVLDWLGDIKEEEVFYSNEGLFGYIKYDRYYELTNCEWKEGSLEDQSEELINYLTSLIK